jgi:hypothetical protein
VAEGPQDAAQAGVFAQERNHIGVGEQVGELGARTGGLVAGEQAQQPAFAVRKFAFWRGWCWCWLGGAGAGAGAVGAWFGGMGDEGAKTAGEKEEAVPDGPLQARREAEGAGLGAEGLAEEEKNRGEAIGEGGGGGAGGARRGGPAGGPGGRGRPSFSIHHSGAARSHVKCCRELHKRTPI